MCATSGGGFALMSEGLGMSAMIETPVSSSTVSVPARPLASPQDRAGRLWQMLGAAFGDYPRVMAAPLDIGDCFKLIPEISISLIVSSVQVSCFAICCYRRAAQRSPERSDFSPSVDRGELITSTNGNGAKPAVARRDYKRYKITESGISRARFPELHHTVATDEHMEDGVLTSDEFTNPAKRRAMMESACARWPALRPPSAAALLGPPTPMLR